jgi:carboxylate-amine ligase
VEVQFRASERCSLGVEVELALVDASTGALVSMAPLVLETLAARHGGEHPTVKAELYQCTVEVVTGICQTVAQARADLESSIAEIRSIVEPHGVDLISAGLHPFATWQGQDRTVDERYDEIVDRIQWPARRLITHGVHFHVGVRSGEKAIQITNSLSTMIPIFLALSSSSPFWQGVDTGLASARAKIFESLPRTGIPPHLKNWAEFEEFMASLIRAEAITTIREVWWDIRPHPDFGTVELRMCDGISTMTEVTALAALAQSSVARYNELIDRGYRLPTDRDWMHRENKWRAARYGLDAEVVVDATGTTRPIRIMIEEAVDELMPFAQRLGCANELASVRTILDAGTSTMRQRRVFERSGSLPDVVHALRAELSSDRLGEVPG